MCLHKLFPLPGIQLTVLSPTPSLFAWLKGIHIQDSDRACFPEKSLLNCMYILPPTVTPGVSSYTSFKEHELLERMNCVILTLSNT